MGGGGEVPSIKGTAFESAPLDLLRLVDEGRISREDLEARLEPEDLRILDEKVSPAAWYPIASYARMVELLAEIEAPGGRRGYLRQRGVRAAQRLADAGIYGQLEASSEKLGSRAGRLVMSLAQVIYNFTRWSYAIEAEGTFTIELSEAGDFPEVSRYATQGFMEAVASRVAGRPMRITSERPEPDRILFRGTLAP